MKDRTKLGRALSLLGGDRERVRALVTERPAGAHIQLSAIDIAAALEDRTDIREAVATVRAWIERGMP